VTKVWFYHMQSQPLARVLPSLVVKTLAKPWKAVIQAASEERLAAVDDLLWTFSDESFVPHGRAGDGDAASQPVYLTTGEDAPNGAEVRFFLDGADPAPALGAGPAYERAIVLFDGNDPDELAAARAQWKALKEAGHAVTYWQQGAGGGWEKRA
jgi:DNA polymerase III subunit chi